MLSRRVPEAEDTGFDWPELGDNDFSENSDLKPSTLGGPESLTQAEWGPSTRAIMVVNLTVSGKWAARKYFSSE